MMRIALCGPGGSGKTVLAERMIEVVGGITLPSAMRHTFKVMKLDNHPNLDKLPIAQRIELQTRGLVFHVGNEHDAARENGFVCDRTIWDFMVYFRTFVPPEHEAYDWYHQIPQMMGHTGYDHVFYVPPFSDAPKPDGTRYVGDQAWVETHVRDTMYQFVKDRYPQVRVLSSMTLEDRCAEAVAIIQQTS